MSKAYEFLKECDCFFVLTINGDYPAGRPFGAVMEFENELYISTSDVNMVHKQMRKNEHVQIVAKKANTREWIRITGKASECEDDKLKKRMIKEYPILIKRFETVGMEHLLMFKIKVENFEIKNGNNSTYQKY